MVAEPVEIHRKNFAASKVELMMGSGVFIAPKIIEVSLNDGGTRTITGDNVVIGTGTTASLSDIPGLREADPMTHVEALERHVHARHSNGQQFLSELAHICLKNGLLVMRRRSFPSEYVFFVAMFPPISGVNAGQPWLLQ